MAERTGSDRRGSAPPRGGAEGTAAEPLGGAVRGWLGRRNAEERAQAVLALLSGKASIDQIARRFGVRAATVVTGQET